MMKWAGQVTVCGIFFRIRNYESEAIQKDNNAWDKRKWIIKNSK